MGSCIRVRAVAVLLALEMVLTVSRRPLQGSESAASHDPWTPAQVTTPEAFARQTGRGRMARHTGHTGHAGKMAKRHLICVGFKPLYNVGHIPGAQYIGPAKDPEGIRDLKQWASPVSRDDPILLYCGCCPMRQCPNVRPAFTALQRMGFTHLKVMDLPHDFATDWVAKGHPTSKGE